jgi:copper chaperone CopZ
MLPPERGSGGKVSKRESQEVKISLYIPEITDESSRHTIDAVLSRLDGVELVRFRPEQQIVEIMGECPLAAIELVLKKAGFPVREVVGVQI